MRRSPPRGRAWLACLVVSLGLARASQAARPTLTLEVAPTPAPAAQAPAPLTLADLEQMAVHGNPTLAQAAAQVEAARGRAVQAGLYPNPTVGYEAEPSSTRRSSRRANCG